MIKYVNYVRGGGISEGKLSEVFIIIRKRNSKTSPNAIFSPEKNESGRVFLHIIGL